MTILIFDAMGVLMRCHHRGPGWVKNGKPVGSAGEFWSQIAQSIQATGSDASTPICLAWEGGRTFRHDLFPAYKAAREEKPADVKWLIETTLSIAEASGIDCVSVEGFEADDVMATLARKAGGRKAILITADKDMMQCLPYARIWGWRQIHKVNDRGQPYSFFEHREVDADYCRERFGVPPEMIPTFLAIAGDSSDGIPGVPRIGEKGAAKLVTMFGDLEAILAGAETLQSAQARQALQEHADAARLYLQITTVRTDVPGAALPWSTVGDIDWPAIFARLDPDSTAVSQKRIRDALNLRDLAA